MDIDDCYKNLANAIVMKSIEDYRNAKAALKKDPYDYKARGQIQSIKNFIRSNWFGQLTTIDPEYLIDRLDKEDKNIADKYRMV